MTSQIINWLDERLGLTTAYDAILDRNDEERVRRLHGALRPERVWLRGRRQVRLATPAEQAWGDTCEDLASLTVLLRAAARSSLAGSMFSRARICCARPV